MSAASALADAALRGYLVDPGAARASAEQGRAVSIEEGDWTAASMAERALGLIAGHLSDSSAAAEHLRTAIRYGNRAGDPGAVARARSDLAYVLVRCGRSAAALREIARAKPHLRHDEQSDLLVMEALVLKVLGRWDDAFDAYRLAFPLVQATGDRQALAVLLGNRGVVQLHRGQPHAAEEDLLEADALFASVGSGLHRAITMHNLGYVAALRGHVPLALARYDQAEVGYTRHREVPLELWRDRCELLLAAGLDAEARAAAQRAVDAAAARHEPAELAEAQVRLAQASLADGDAVTAQRVAEEAACALARQRRPGWAVLARWTRMVARATQEPESINDVMFRRTATRLERAGWRGSALEARMRAAQVALACGRDTAARCDLEEVARSRHSGPVWHRQLGWHGEALLRASRGDRAGALRAAGRGLALIDEHRATLGATDLRAAASSRVSALASFGLRLAIESRRPQTVWRWAERTRAAALLHPPVRPSEDEEVDAALAELRHVALQRQEAAAANRPAEDLMRRQVHLEERIRELVRRAGGNGDGQWVVPDAQAVLAALGDRALVEFARCDDALWAVVAVEGRLRLCPLGDVAPVTQELHHLFFALRRMIGMPATGSARVRDRLSAAADRLDAALLRPLALGERDLVVIPTDPLHALPWSVLPSCRGRGVSVSPSARLWCKAQSARPSPSRHRVLVAGPGLQHAEPEVAALARLHPDASVFTGAEARVADVLAAMADADLVHLAGHGRFRGDNPQFSGVDLADGPLTGHDIERLPRGPAQAVLSACESGQAITMAGGEQMGLAAALMSVGVRSVVAPVLQVRDAESAPFMLDLHRGLQRGLTASAALAAAGERALSGTPTEAATGAAFICVGA